MSERVSERGNDMPSLRYTFITHHHSDYNAEFGLL
jgi:ribonuclease BN (tRNA processing enzyme)